MKLAKTNKRALAAFIVCLALISAGTYFFNFSKSIGPDKSSIVELIEGGGSGIKGEGQQSAARIVQAGYRPHLAKDAALDASGTEEQNQLKAKLAAFGSQVGNTVQRGASKKKRRLRRLADALAAQYQMDPAEVRVITSSQGVLRNLTFKREISIGSPALDALTFVENNQELFGLGALETLEVASIRQPEREGVGSIVLRRKFKGVVVKGNDIGLTMTPKGIKGVLGQFEIIDPSFDVSATISTAELLAAASNLESHEGFVPIADTAQPQVIFSEGMPVFVYSIHARDTLGRTIEVFVRPRAKSVFKIQVKHFTGQTSVTGKNLDGDETQFYVDDRGSISYLRNNPLQEVKSDSEWIAQYSEFDRFVDGFLYWIPFSADRPSGPWSREAVSAVQSVDTTAEYLFQTHGIEVTGANDQKIDVIVNDNADEASADNASWGNGVMRLGSGGRYFSNLAGSLDVIAHELAHGVTQNTSRLVYENQPGALNESFSDIIGAQVDRNDWLIGEDVTLTSDFLRSMKNPSAGSQPSHMDQFMRLPNTADGDWGGVHINSGIPNRMFYLLAEGLTEEGLGVSVGRAKADRITFQAFTTLTRNSDFDAAAAQMLLVAETFYGDGGEEQAAVIAAWAAVGIDIDPLTNDAPSEQPDEERKQTYTLPAGDEVLVDLRPRDGIVYDPRDDVFDLYAIKVCVSAECAGVGGGSGTPPTQELTVVESTRVGPLNDIPLAKSIPSVATEESGLTYAFYVATDGNIYGSLVSAIDYPPLKIDFDRSVARAAISRDFSRLAFVFENSRDIYIYSFGQQTLEVVPVTGVSFSQEGSGENVDVVDALAFSADSDQLVFDYRVCRPSYLSDDNCDYVWSIGLYDVDKRSFDYPFPNLQQGIDLGFPRLSSIGGERIVFQAFVYEDCLNGGDCSSIVGAILQYDYFSDELSVIEATNLSLNGPAARKFGWPDYFPGDTGVTWSSSYPEVMFQALDENYEVSSSASAYWERENIAGLIHRAAYLGVYSEISVTPQSQQLGALIRGQSKTRTLTIENRGNQGLEITGISTPDGVQTTLENILLPAGSSEEFDITFNSKGLRYGEYSGLVRISSNADRGNADVTVVAIVDRDTDGDGIPNSKDRDDDNDGVPDVRDAFPLDDSESVDTDRDGIGNNADTDDDGDGLSDESEIQLGTNPLDADTDGDTVPDGEELAMEFDPFDGECPSWYCLKNKGWLWERAQSLSDADRDGLNLAQEVALGTNPDTADSDDDGLGDGDEVELGTNPVKADTDADGLSDQQEIALSTDPLSSDSDGDSMPDGLELSEGFDPNNPSDCPEWFCVKLPVVISLMNAGSLDFDGDGLSRVQEEALGTDWRDEDSDDDGIEDGLDAFPLDTSESLDTDSDGIGNNSDTDDDGDGVADESDAFPLDSTETLDTDSDGIGNNSDTDDDGDGVPDSEDSFPLDASKHGNNLWGSALWDDANWEQENSNAGSWGSATFGTGEWGN